MYTKIYVVARCKADFDEWVEKNIKEDQIAYEVPVFSVLKGLHNPTVALVPGWERRPDREEIARELKAIGARMYDPPKSKIQALKKKIAEIESLEEGNEWARRIIKGLETNEPIFITVEGCPPMKVEYNHPITQMMLVYYQNWLQENTLRIKDLVSRL